MASANQFDIQNPLTQYLRPEFPKQPQPVPGLASKMQPVPDHGKISYKGSGLSMAERRWSLAATRASAERLPLRLRGKAPTSQSTIFRKSSPTPMR